MVTGAAAARYVAEKKSAERRSGADILKRDHERARNALIERGKNGAMRKGKFGQMTVGGVLRGTSPRWQV